MEYVGEFISYTLMSVFAQNILLGRAMGTNTIINAIKLKKSLLQLSIVIGIYSTLGIMIMWVLSYFIFSERGYLICALIYSLICVGIYFGSDRALLKISPETHDVWCDMLPHALINSIILGVPLAMASESITHWYAALGYGVGTGISFGIGALIVKNGYEILDNPNMPSAFRGMPAMMLYLGILSIGFCVFL